VGGQLVEMQATQRCGSSELGEKNISQSGSLSSESSQSSQKGKEGRAPKSNWGASSSAAKQPNRQDKMPQSPTRTTTTTNNNEVQQQQQQQQQQMHVCRLCDKLLSSSSSLDRHMLTHSGERPFVCKRCHMTFTTNGK